MKAKKNLIVAGDRVLIEPDDKEGITSTGLYLPPTVKEKEKVQTGYIVKTGPGYLVHDVNSSTDEPWKQRKKPRYIPLQAMEGDYAIFLKDSAVEIEFEGKKYLIVPHSAILALIRTELVDE